MRLGRTSEVLHGGGVRPEKVKALGAGPAIAADAVALVRLGGGGRRAGRLVRREPAAEHGVGRRRGAGSRDQVGDLATFRSLQAASILPRRDGS